MANIEVEDGEAYCFRGGDDDENIDPDRDFSYIDQKIANVLGQYQKDFMGGISAESLGARFGGYGSFLPMQQRSPPILSNQKSQSHVTLKSPQDLPLERVLQNPTTSVNQKPPVKPLHATGDQSVEAVSESGISSMKSQLKPQFSGDSAPDHQTKKPLMNNSGKNSLKFRVKMAPDNISSLDKSAIYSGLGLDISPSSSPEGSPSEDDEISADLQEMNADSPSFIVKIMTSLPFSHNDLLSPLQDSLVNIKDKADYGGTSLPGIKEGLPANIVQENVYLKGKKEERKDRKSKVVKDTTKVKRSKQKESSSERELKQKAQSQKPMELMKENCEYYTNTISLRATTKEENGASIAREVVSNAFASEVGAYSEEKDCASLMNGSFDIDIGSPVKQVHVARQKAKDEHVSAKKHDAMDDDEKGVSSHGKTQDRYSYIVPRSDTFTEKRDDGDWREEEVNKFPKKYGISKPIVKEEVLESSHSKDKNVIPKSESSSEKRNEGRRKEGMDFLKQQSTAKGHIKEEAVASVCPIQPSVHEKENGYLKMIPKNEEVGRIPVKIEEKGKYNDVSQEMKYEDVEAVESLKQKTHSREITRSLAEQGLPNEKENLSSVVKSKVKDNQVGESPVGPSRGSMVVSSSASKIEAINSRANMPSKNKVDTDQHREMRKNNEIAGKANPRKKGKEGSSRDFGMGVSEQEAQAFPTKLKDRSSGMKTSSTFLESNIEDFTGVIPEKTLIDVPPAANAPPVTYLEDWVECEKCHKWRLLPLGMSAASLTGKIWTCSMITWLPGMNKCSFSEDDTTNALRALYVPVDSASLVPNSEPVYQDGNASVNVRAGGLNTALPSQASGFDTLPTGGKKKNVKADIDAFRQTAVQDFRTPIRKEKVRSVMRNSKNLKTLPRESDSARKSGDGKPSKTEKKRLADVDAYGVSKKTKRVREQSIEAYDPGALRISQNFAKGSPKYPLVKDKKRTQSDITSNDDGTYSEPGKKRKIKDKQQRDYSVVRSLGKGGHLVNNSDAGKHSVTEHRTEKKSRSSNIQARESSATKGNHRTQSDDDIANLGGGGGSILHKGGRSEEQFHMDRVSRKAPGGRTSEMALDMGLSDNATTSSSSKVSCKVKAKVSEVKSSPAGSTSSSPLKASKLDPDKGTSKKSMSYNEQRLRFGAESAANECAPPNELFRDRKSNLSRNSGIISDTTNDDNVVKKVSSGRHSSSHVIDAQPKLEHLKHTGGKLDPSFEGTSTLQRNLVSNSPNKLHLGGTNTEKGRSHASKIDNEKEVSSNAHDGPECEGGSGTNGGKSDNVSGKPSTQVVVGNMSLRTSHHTGPATTSSDVEASSSRKKDNFHRAANTALREAKDLKHNANRLKVSGSSLESTGVSFQAALKFLHGASLLEPGNSESRGGEMTPNEVYSSTAKLCENCALEYERCNDMASAALAYKCMEVAYMRLVYCNDLVASRDRKELQMAVRVAPQVESPSSSASDIDNLNQVAMDSIKDGHSAMDQRSHVVSAGNRPNFIRLLDFTHDINLAMEASRRSQSAFAAAMPVFAQAGNVEGISSIKRVLDFSFHDVDGLLHLVRLAMESIKC